MLQLSFVKFNPNSYILVEGNSVTDHFFIIQSGKVRCFHEVQIPGKPPIEHGPGDFVGVISCMSGHLQTESVVAITPVVAIMVKKEQYPELIMRNTPVAMKIVRSFAKDMRALNDNLTKLTVNKVNIESLEGLYKIAEYYESIGSIDIASYGYYRYLKQCPNGLNVSQAKQKFLSLKPRSKAVYYEQNSDMIREYPQNTMIFSEFQKGNDMFIIQEGSVKITKVVEGKEVTLALLKKGDLFGEMALLENKLRSASAIAREDCKLLVINHANFDQMVATQPAMVSKLTTLLAERLWTMYRQLLNTQYKEIRERVIDMLSIQLEKQGVYKYRGEYNLGITVDDLVNLCGFDAKQKAQVVQYIYSDGNLKVVSEQRIVIFNVGEILKLADFYRKQYSKRVECEN